MSGAYAIREPEAQTASAMGSAAATAMLPARFRKARYTFADYITWGDVDFWAEIIDGEIYMLGSPITAHQSISFELSGQLWYFLKGKPYKAYTAPYAVRLFPKDDGSDDLVLQPDLVVVCDPAKWSKQSCNGAPDLVVEILSPSTASHDRVFKRHQYLKAGVREYWIIDPVKKTVEVNILDTTSGEHRYVATTYGNTETIAVSVLPGCGISLPDVFEDVDE